eukprot:11231362-Alexandrium_andersonii.AAC.1
MPAARVAPARPGPWRGGRGEQPRPAATGHASEGPRPPRCRYRGLPKGKTPWPPAPGCSRFGVSGPGP